MIKKILKWIVISFIAFIMPGIVLAGCTSETEESIQEVVQEEEKEIQSTIEPTIEPTAEPTVEPTIQPLVEPSIQPSVEPISNIIEQPTQTNQNNTKVVIKKSNSGICHAPGTTYYNRTINYISFDSIDECLVSGGRLPKK